MSLCRRTVEDRLPLERVPLACTFGSPLDLHVRQSLSLQGPVDLDHHRVEFLVAHQQCLSMTVHNFTCILVLCGWSSQVRGGGGGNRARPDLRTPWGWTACRPPRPSNWCCTAGSYTCPELAGTAVHCTVKYTLFPCRHCLHQHHATGWSGATRKCAVPNRTPRRSQHSLGDLRQPTVMASSTGVMG